MYHHEHEIAQAEFAAFQAKFNRQPTEGMTVQVPNVIDRTLAALKHFTTGTNPAPRGATLRSGAAVAK